MKLSVLTVALLLACSGCAESSTDPVETVDQVAILSALKENNPRIVDAKFDTQPFDNSVTVSLELNNPRPLRGRKLQQVYEIVCEQAIGTVSEVKVTANWPADTTQWISHTQAVNALNENILQYSVAIAQDGSARFSAC